MDSYKLDENQRRILKEFRSNVQDVLLPHHDDRYLLRWLRAREFDLRKAEKMFREDCRFRKKLGSERILQDYKMKPVLRECGIDAFLGFDYEGHPVHFLHIGITDFKGFIRSLTFMDIVRHFVHILEYDEHKLKENNKKTGKCVEKTTYIADFTGFRMRQFSDRTVIRYGINLIKFYQDHYPENLHVMYMVNVPSFFNCVFNIFKPFFNDVVLSKIQIYGTDGWQDEVFNLIPREIVPGFLGGTRTDPNGDPMCKNIITWKAKILPCYFMTDLATLHAGEQGVKEMIVKKGSSAELEYPVHKPNSVLCWEFQTKDYNIKFGVFYKKFPKNVQNDINMNSIKNAKKEELLPVEAVDCQEIVEKGELICKRPGIYILHFDNTYSWITSKQVLYKVEIKPPAELNLEEL